jgi:hypothetical protein
MKHRDRIGFAGNANAAIIRTLVALSLAFAVVAPAAEKAPLRDEFQRLYAEFGQKTMVRLITVSEPKAV